MNKFSDMLGNHIKVEQDLVDRQGEYVRLHAAAPLPVKQFVAQIVRRNQASLVPAFYEAIPTRPGSHAYLDNTIVHESLQSAMARWLEAVFPDRQADIDLMLRLQAELGALHARMRVPPGSVIYGIRALRQALYDLLQHGRLSAAELAQAHTYVSGALDISLIAMTAAHATNLERTSRADEALRLYSMGNDLQAERERQRAALAEWGQNAFYGAQVGATNLIAGPLSHSDFGIWLAHRGDLMFAQFREFETAMELVRRIDTIADELGTPDMQARTGRLRELKGALDQTGQLLALLFDRVINLGAARDPVTRLLSRRFLRSALSREIALHESLRRPLSLVMLEISQFGPLRERLGEAGADVVIQQTASMIFNAARSSDSLFSHGRESFMVIRVESTDQDAMAFGRALAETYAATHFEVEGQTVLNNTLLCAVAEYTGHPEPRHLIERTEAGMRSARSAVRS